MSPEDGRLKIDLTDAVETAAPQLIQAEDERRQVADEEARRTACPECEEANKRIADLEAEVHALKNSDLEWQSVMSMIADRIAHFGGDVCCGEGSRESTPPYSYDDWLTCVIVKREKKLKDRIAELEAQLEQAREAVRLLNCMIDCGERHSEHSRAAIRQALDGVKTLREGGENA